MLIIWVHLISTKDLESFENLGFQKKRWPKLGVTLRERERERESQLGTCWIFGKTQKSVSKRAFCSSFIALWSGKKYWPAVWFIFCIFRVSWTQQHIFYTQISHYSRSQFLRLCSVFFRAGTWFALFRLSGDCPWCVLKWFSASTKSIPGRLVYIFFLSLYHLYRTAFVRDRTSRWNRSCIVLVFTLILTHILYQTVFVWTHTQQYREFLYCTAFI